MFRRSCTDPKVRPFGHSGAFGNLGAYGNLGAFGNFGTFVSRQGQQSVVGAILQQVQASAIGACGAVSCTSSLESQPSIIYS